MSTKHHSAVALEAFTEVALAARRSLSRRRVLPGLALSALGDDPVDVLGCSPPAGTWPRRAGPPPLAGATAA